MWMLEPWASSGGTLISRSVSDKERAWYDMTMSENFNMRFISVYFISCRIQQVRLIHFTWFLERDMNGLVKRERYSSIWTWDASISQRRILIHILLFVPLQNWLFRHLVRYRVTFWPLQLVYLKRTVLLMFLLSIYEIILAGRVYKIAPRVIEASIHSSLA